MNLPLATWRFLTVFAVAALAITSWGSPSLAAQHSRAGAVPDAAPAWASRPSVPVDDQDTLPVMRIVAHDASFDAPATVLAGLVSVDLQNAGGKAVGAQLLRLNPGVTLDAIAAAAQGVREDPDALLRLFTAYGGPQGVTPGGEQQVTVNLIEGDYIVLNTLDHFDHTLLFSNLLAGQLPAQPPGMGIPPIAGLPPLPAGAPPFVVPAFPLFYQQFKVTGPAQQGTDPAANAEVLMPDFSYQLPPSFASGRNVIRVTNTGAELHEMAIGRIAAGVSLDSLIAYFQDPSQEKSLTDVVINFPNASVDGVPGVSTLSPGLSATVSVDFQPGNYVMVCFLRDPDSGKPHAALGMIAGFSVR